MIMTKVYLKIVHFKIGMLPSFRPTNIEIAERRRWGIDPIFQ